MITLGNIINHLYGAYHFFYPGKIDPVEATLLDEELKEGRLSYLGYTLLTPALNCVERALNEIAPSYSVSKGQLHLADDFFSYVRRISPPGFSGYAFIAFTRHPALWRSDLSRLWSKKETTPSIHNDYSFLSLINGLGRMRGLNRLYQSAFTLSEMGPALMALHQPERVGLYGMGLQDHSLEAIEKFQARLVDQDPGALRLFLDPRHPDYTLPGTVIPLWDSSSLGRLTLREFADLIHALYQEDIRGILPILAPFNPDPQDLDRLIRQLSQRRRVLNADMSRHRDQGNPPLTFNLTKWQYLILCLECIDSALTASDFFKLHDTLIEGRNSIDAALVTITLRLAYAGFIKSQAQGGRFSLSPHLQAIPGITDIHNLQAYLLNGITAQEAVDAFLTRREHLRSWFEWFTPETEKKMLPSDVYDLARIDLTEDLLIRFKTGHAESAFGFSFELCYPNDGKLHRLAILGFHILSFGEIRIVCIQGADTHKGTPGMAEAQEGFLAFSGGLPPHQWLALTIGKVLLDLARLHKKPDGSPMDLKWIKGEFLGMAYPHKALELNPNIQTVQDGRGFWRSAHPDLASTSQRYIKLRRQHDLLEDKLKNLEANPWEVTGHHPLDDARRRQREALVHKIERRLDKLKAELLIYQLYEKGNRTPGLYHLMAKKLGFEAVDRSDESPWLVFRKPSEEFGRALRSGIKEIAAFQDSVDALEEGFQYATTFNILNPSAAPKPWDAPRNIFARRSEPPKRHLRMRRVVKPTVQPVVQNQNDGPIVAAPAIAHGLTSVFQPNVLPQIR